MFFFCGNLREYETILSEDLLNPLNIEEHFPECRKLNFKIESNVYNQKIYDKEYCDTNEGNNISVSHDVYFNNFIFSKTNKQVDGPDYYQYKDIINGVERVWIGSKKEGGVSIIQKYMMYPHLFKKRN